MNSHFFRHLDECRSGEFDFVPLNLIYIKNSSVECDSGQVRFVNGRSIEISITRSPLSTGSVMFNPFGLYTSSFCIAM